MAMSERASAASIGTKDRGEWRIRDAAGERDAFYLLTMWHHYFATPYTPGKLPEPLANIAGWLDDDDDRDVESYGIIATHSPRGTDQSVDVGGGLVSVFDHERVLKDIPDGPFSASALAGERNAWLWFGVVDPAFRGRGIGRALFEARLDWVDERDVDMILATGWERRDGRTSRPLFERHGFIELPIEDGEYAAERDICPDCGAYPSNDTKCSCDGVLWARDA